MSRFAVRVSRTALDSSVKGRSRHWSGTRRMIRVRLVNVMVTWVEMNIAYHRTLLAAGDEPLVWSQAVRSRY